jgi:glycosyltransferase involved in cell wall biosynthesis
LGDDVSVYAGWLEGGRRAGETWDETDETGLPVRWIATARAWTEWADRRNVDNPTVTADFATYVQELRPDVVHFHAVQSFGAGLLPAAKASGARVVVTMHDFWWCCGRQFLVDRDYRPCCLVVDAGGCACHVDRRWLDRRNAALAAQLRVADLVLAPSASAAAVLTANGLGRVEVDENGVVAPPAPAGQQRDTDGPRRFLFTGGTDPMKGWPVLADAVRRLSGTPGWQLVAYGVEPAEADGLPVELRPPFAPDDVAAVYADADVLVLPSVMRESFSLVTREALAAGLPVVTTDTLGPEEVVVHGRNGLVVPAGDAVALSGALRQLIDAPDLLASLRAGAAAPPMRTVDEQAAGLRHRYEAIGRGNRGLLPPNGGLGRVLFVTGIEGSPLRYRVRLPAEALGLVGVRTAVRHYRDPDLAQIAKDADAVVVYRVPATTQVLVLLEGVRRRGAPLFFDVDDLIFDPDLANEIPALRILPPEEADFWLEGVRRYRTTMEACDAFIGSTPMLCRHAEEVTGLPAYEFANGVGLTQSRLADAALARPRRPGPLRVGYLSGTDTHAADWAFVEPAIVEVLERRDDVELWLGGYVEPSPVLDRFRDRVLRLPFVPWTELPGIVRDLDVNLVPLEPGSRFNEAKSAIKWLEAALAETVTVASPTEPFVDAIVPGANGRLAGDTAEWVAAVTEVLDAPGDRARMASRARRDALVRWSPHVQGPRYRQILTEPLRSRRRSDAGWDPVALDEPAWRRRHPLEQYPPGRRRRFRRSSG